MKKYTFLVYHREYARFLDLLREQGVVHVAQKQGGTMDDEEQKNSLQLAQRCKIALSVLDRYKDKEHPLSADHSIDGLQLLTDIEHYLQERDSLTLKRQSLEKESERMSPWGNFSWNTIRQIEATGYKIDFFSCVASRFDPEWHIKYGALEVSSQKSQLYFVTITPAGTLFEIDAETIHPGLKTVADLDAEVKEIDAHLAAIDSALCRAEAGGDALKRVQAEAFEKADLRKVYLNTAVEAEDRLMILEGYCPVDNESSLIEVLDAQGVYYVSEVPQKSDDLVPVQLKNGKFSSAFEFIGGLYELPNYHKSDLTPYFAPFYMLFFGFCFADVVYGVLLAALGLYFKKKVRIELQPVMRLLTYLGTTAIFTGLITGNVGGIALEHVETNWAWFEHIKQYILTPERLFYASLIVGAIQIVFGQIVKAVTHWKTDGFASTISTWGWLLLVIGGGIVFLLNKVGVITPEFAKITTYIILVVSGTCVFLLNHPGHSIFANIGEGVWDTYEKATGWLSDLLSYIRLFAICIAGAVLAIVFNSLATSLSGNTPVVSQIVMVLILLFGHFINIFMAILASFVHPLRLTFVEFYKNAGFVGGGKAYRPFAPYHEEFKIL